MSTQVADPLMCVPPDRVVDIWPVVRPMIEAAYAEVDEKMPPDTLPALSDGKLLLWVSVYDGEIIAALITALLPRPSGLICKLVVCGGSGMDIWLGGHAQIEAYARAEQCAKLQAEGRPGWARILPGYDTKRVVLEKRL